MKKLLITFLLTVFCFAGIANAKPEPRPTFDGVTVTAALHSGPFVNAWGPHVKRIKELYGINLELVGIPVNELYDKSILELSMGTGAYDIVQYNPGWVGDYIDFMRPLDDYMDRWDPGWMDIHEGFREWENTYGGQRVSLTMDGDVMIFYYNKNMFEDPKEMADFKSTYGYDLAPPANYDQVLDIQKHFQRDTDGDGTIDQAGYSDPIIKRGRGQYPYLMRLFAYQKEAGITPNYFDPDTMEEHSPFLVQDPLFNSILIRSNEALINLYSIIGNENEKVQFLTNKQIKGIQSMNSKLFDNDLGAYIHYDLRNNKPISFVSSSSFIPLFCGAPDKKKAEILISTLIKKFGGDDKFLCASFDPTNNRFNPKKYWRGPIWINLNWMLYNGLKRYGSNEIAKRVKQDSIELIKREGFCEYFDPRKDLCESEKIGYGGNNFSWTAALFIDFINDKF